MERDEVIHDWNVIGEKSSPPLKRVAVHDETLRDGIQCPSAHDPDIDEKVEMVRLMARCGIDSVDVGLPGAGPRAVADSQRLVELIRDEKLGILPGCAARTHANDITPIIEISQRTGVPVEVMAFIGSSPIRMYAEGWGEDRLESLTRSAIKLSADAGLPTSYVTEDTVRSRPSTLKRLFTAAIEEGATRLVLCDTVGHATPNGVYNLVSWTKKLLADMGRSDVGIDWHGHNDRGLALVNALYAVDAGADRVHGTVLGIGERVGNTSTDQVLVNLRLLGSDEHDVTPLAKLVELVAKAVRWEVPVNYPVFGADAFRTGTGVHAAAVIKAEKKGDTWLADRIYSGVPAAWFGREQEITIGHQSGESNIRYWLHKRGYGEDDTLVRAIFERAKMQSAMLTDDDIRAVIESHA
ncbi:MAG: 2-isopropylmalate synthase [Alphaproteobacteria bacterium]|nr:2-isopropylmalate synthase [Alphaproteobacteria bacterium]